LRIFKIRSFHRFARKEGIGDPDLCHAVDQAEDGLVDAGLGGGLIKQRLARKGGGKRGGYRVLLAFRPGERAVFLHGFAKNEKDNIRPDELLALRRLAAEVLAQGDQAIEDLIADDKWMEVFCDEKEQT
jgi:hypothetical protein